MGLMLQTLSWFGRDGMANYTLFNLPQKFSVGDTITISHTGSSQTLPFKNQKSIQIDLYGGRGGDALAYDSNSTSIASAISDYPLKISGRYQYAGTESLYVNVGGNGTAMSRVDGLGIAMQGDNWTTGEYTDPSTFNGGSFANSVYQATRIIDGEAKACFDLRANGGGCTDVRTGTDVSTQILVSPGTGGSAIYGQDQNYSIVNGSNVANSNGTRLNGSYHGGGGGYYGGTANKAGTAYYDATKITSYSSASATTSSLAVITILAVDFDVKSLYRYVI